MSPGRRFAFLLAAFAAPAPAGGPAEAGRGSDPQLLPDGKSIAYPVRGHHPRDPVRNHDVLRRWLEWLEWLDPYLK